MAWLRTRVLAVGHVTHFALRKVDYVCAWGPTYYIITSRTRLTILDYLVCKKPVVLLDDVVSTTRSYNFSS